MFTVFEKLITGGNNLYFNFRAKKSFIAAAFLFVFFLFSAIAYPKAEQTGAAVSQKTNELTLPVIMYHSMLKDESLQGTYVISPELFKNDIQALKKRGYKIIGAQELVDYVDGKLELPEKCAMLTFDDGYYNNYLYAYQIAREENIKFILSPIGINSEQSNGSEHMSPSYSHCTWDQLKEMVDSGHVEIMNHSYDMHQNSARMGTKIINGENTEEYKKLLRNDLNHAQQLFKENVGTEPIGFTYPFGAVCEQSQEVVKDMGFKLAFTCEETLNTIKTGDSGALFEIGRYLRNNTESSDSFLDRILPDEAA